LTTDRWCRIDVLINSAGHGLRGSRSRTDRWAVAHRSRQLPDERDPPDAPGAPVMV